MPRTAVPAMNARYHLVFPLLVLIGSACGHLLLPQLACADDRGTSGTIALSADLRERCVTILRAGLRGDEFWPAMHAAEGLTIAGHGDEVRAFLARKVDTETDDQRRCGLARELVRAGDLGSLHVLFDVLSSSDPHGHTHARSEERRVGKA